MDIWAKATPEDREALFNQTAVTKGISPEIVEKDFWVCWTLHQVFQFRDFPRLIFKGGTSLSKAFGIIQRFSEDIDLVINRHELGFNDANDPANQQGTKVRDRTIEKLKSSCRNVIASEFAPRLEARVRSILGGHGWSLEIDPNAPDGDTVEFKYPPGVPSALASGYIRRAVRLELGCRGDQIPCEEATLTPYAAEAFPDQFEVRSVQINAIGPERTFWEKATILHREYYRAEAGKPVSERVFRHYHDVVLISKHPRGLRALKDLNLLEQVVEHKQHFFREGGARYELAKKGTLRLAPGSVLEAALRRDYEKMREMYFGGEPDFDAVMADIRELERAFNA
ncbi:MAG: nucleotidyl transferase AbiEii/AbiGii toxin family protein [Terriglobia bacterium]